MGEQRDLVEDDGEEGRDRQSPQTVDEELDPDLLVRSQDQARAATGLARLIGRWQAFWFFPLLTRAWTTSRPG